MSDLSRENLSALEHRGWDSLCRSAGGGFYGSIMTEDAVMILVNGMVLDRDSIAASLDDAPPWTEYTLTDARCIPLGPDAAALVYEAVARRQGQEEPFEALMTSVYRVVDGQVRLALYQQTATTH